MKTVKKDVVNYDDVHGPFLRVDSESVVEPGAERLIEVRTDLMFQTRNMKVMDPSNTEPEDLAYDDLDGYAFDIVGFRIGDVSQILLDVRIPSAMFVPYAIGLSTDVLTVDRVLALTVVNKSDRPHHFVADIFGRIPPPPPPRGRN